MGPGIRSTHGVKRELSFRCDGYPLFVSVAVWVKLKNLFSR
jgi:hypothetical protein